MDELRKHYKDNPDERDVFSTDFDEVWSGVEHKLNRHKVRARNYTFLKIAASFIILAGVFFLLGRSGEVPAQLTEFMETENYYSGLIQDKMVLVNERRDLIDPVVLDDIEILDQALEELREDLKDDAHNEEVIRAMVKNYKVKLEILEQILEQIEESEHVETNI